MGKRFKWGRYYGFSLYQCSASIESLINIAGVGFRTYKKDITVLLYVSLDGITSGLFRACILCIFPNSLKIEL